MKSFDMLVTGPAEGWSPNRWYINGKRVSKEEYRHFVGQAKRQDTFHSYTRNGRAYVRSCCYI